jgi:zinc transporter ZupT
MNLLTQLTVLAVFIGLAVYLARGLPKRVVLVANAFAAGSVLFLIISTVSTVITRIAELSQANQAAVGFLGNPWVFALITLFAIFIVPMIMIFTVGERRRSVIIAVAIGLYNLGFGLTVGSETVSGILGISVNVGVLLALIFLLEGVAIGALLMKARPNPLFVLGLGATAILPALVGFNLTSAGSLDLIVPLTYSISAGFMLFYLPFILGLTDGGNSNDIKWHFIGLLTGLFLTGLVTTAFSLLGR